jgi:putative transcriptional regulator
LVSLRGVYRRGSAGARQRRLRYTSDMEKVNLTQHFLIAMPAMADPHFAKSLTFVCEHNDQGALGIVVNRPTEMNLHALLEQVSIAPETEAYKSVPIHFGGPVQVDRGFVLHTPLGEWQSTLQVSPDLGLTTSKDILEAVARGEGPRQILVTLGYAGWAPGQLEHELAQNAWLTVQAKPEVIFDLPADERLAAAMSLLGVDYAKLSDTAGHA